MLALTTLNYGVELVLNVIVKYFPMTSAKEAMVKEYFP